MNDKFKKLIEYIVNEDESRARELFHEIVVEKSREIYESMMDDEDLIYEVGETAITLSKYIGEQASNAKKVLDNATIITDGSI